MTEPKPTRPAVFIEKIFPVTLLNKQVYYEHGGNPFKGLHRWYSRKPLSFSRASVLGSLLPDTVTMEEFEYLLGLNRRVAGHPDSTTKLYKTPPSPERIKQVHDLCEQTWGTRTPTVLDAFAGGGSIPFEAVRYGLNVLASDLNPVAVVTMKAAMEYPLKFGPDLQHEIDKWVKWVGDEAEKRLAEFFPSQEGETVQNYLWAHTVVCPSCESVVPLSPNWWLYKRPEKQNLHKWCAVKPIPNLAEKRVDFELVKGSKGKGSTIQTGQDAYDPNSTVTLKEGEGKCPNCDELIDEKVIYSQAKSEGFGFQLYAIYIRDKKGDINFRLPLARDLEAFGKASEDLDSLRLDPVFSSSIPSSKVFAGDKTDELLNRGIDYWDKIFNPRQLLTVSTYHFLIQDIKEKIIKNYQSDHASAILIYLAFILDQCIDKNCRLTNYDSSRANVARATAQHAFGFMWNYPEVSGAGRLWKSCAKKVFGNFQSLCSYLGRTSNQLLPSDKTMPGNLVFSCSPASNLFSISDLSVDVVVTDPPYYKTIQYAELSDFFYVWQKGILSDIYPDFFWMELTDKNQEAVTNISRFRNMDGNPEELANRDYEAKMALAFAEYFRVLRDDGVLAVQFNHKETGAWDVLAKSLIDAGFEITASWAVSTENPQNLHQAQKNSVSSTVLLVCRKRDPNAGSAWWDDLRPELANLVEQRAPEFEANDIGGIDLYLSAFGPALNVFSRAWPVLDSSGVEMRPEVAFGEARKAIANYRFRKLLEADTAGFDPLTQWYILAWDAFRAREFPFDEARQLALAVGGFNVSDLAKTHKLIDSASGTCKLLTPQQRLKKRAFSTNPDEFTAIALVDGLHAIIALYLEEQSIDPVRRFLKTTGLLSNDLFMRAWEVALKAIPHIGDERKRMVEEKALADLWLAMDEIQAKVLYVQPELAFEEGQMGLF
ncbi:MAG: DNA methylase [Leptolyngbya sp.]|nr:MAG: DNA methylase [Leptolyngbya sp.]